MSSAKSERWPLTRHAGEDCSEDSLSEVEVPRTCWSTLQWRAMARVVVLLGSTLALLVLATLAFCAGMSELPNSRGVLAVRLPGVQELVLAAESVETVLHPGEDCWVPCGNVSGGCPKFCGAGNACCRYRSSHDPPECWGVAQWSTQETHTCVKPIVPVTVWHSGQGCYTQCGNRSGRCDWCGEGNACCRAGLNDRVSCSGVRFWPVVDRHTCVKPYLQPPGPALPPAPKMSRCLPGQVEDPSSGECVPSPTPTVMKFYMYKALGDGDYHMENTNPSSLTGVLMYLQDEVLSTCPRKFNITRVVRYLVTMKNPASLSRPPNSRQFGQYVQFSNGKCITNNSLCNPLWANHGYVVGCRLKDISNPAVSNYDRPPPVDYSLPGKCPSMEYGLKSPECKSMQRGGQCSSPDGDVDCTWKAEFAGEISISALANIASYKLFCKFGGVEYDPATDHGTGMNFWDGRRDPVACRQRVARVRQLFQLKYPYWEVSVGEPPCDSGQ